MKEKLLMVVGRTREAVITYSPEILVGAWGVAWLLSMAYPVAQSFAHYWGWL